MSTEFYAHGDFDPNKNASFLDSKNCHFLIQIVNQLDPASFVKFARTCRDLQTFCFNTKDIRVTFGGRDHSKKFNFVVHKDRQHRIEAALEEERNLLPQPVSAERLEQILKMPFRIEIETAVIWTESREDQDLLINAAQEFLQQFSRPRIRNLVLSLNTVNWIAWAEFIKKFDVVSLEIMQVRVTPIPPDIFSLFTKNLNSLCYFEYASDDIVISSTVKELHLGGARISKETFKKLIQKSVTSNFIRWSIGRERPPPGTNLDTYPDPFIDACHEAIKTVKYDMYWEHMEPCVLYWTPNNRSHFHFVREDGVRGVLDILPYIVLFTLHE